MKPSATSEMTSHPLEHSRNLQRMLLEVIDHMREDVTRVEEPRFQTLLETAAEALIGLKNAFEQYDRGAESAWRR